MFTDEKIYSENSEIKDAIIEFALSLRPTHKIDIIFNKGLSDKASAKSQANLPDQKISLPAAYRKIKQFDAQVHQQLLGKYFYKKPFSRRILSICFPERIEKNFHYHGVFRVPANLQVNFETTAILEWFRVCRSGELVIRPLNDAEAIKQATDYCLKEIFKIQNYEHFVLSSQFWSPKIKSTISQHRSFRP